MEEMVMNYLSSVDLRIHDSVIGVLFCFCMLFAESAPSLLRRCLETKPMLRLGEASYAQYILQIPFFIVWSAIGQYVLHHIVHADRPGTPLFLMTLILVSVGVYEGIERPVRLRIRKLVYGVTSVPRCSVPQCDGRG